MALEINGERVEDALIQEELQFLKQQLIDAQAAEAAHHSPSSSSPPAQKAIPSDEELFEQVKTALIRKTLLRQEAIKQKIEVSPAEREETLAQLRENLPKELSSASTETLEQYVDMRLKIDKLLRKVTADLNPIEDRHIKSFYDSNREHYTKEARIDLAYLAEVIPLADGEIDTPEGMQKVKNVPNTLKETLLSLNHSPERTQTLIRTLLAKTPPNTDSKKEATRGVNREANPPANPAFSQAINGKQASEIHPGEQQLPRLLAGELGPREISKIDPAIRATVEKTPVGTLSTPLRLANVYYVFLIRQHLPAGISPLDEIIEEVKEDLHETLVHHKQEIFVQKLLQTSTITDYQLL